ncbi:hypothetical protein DUNSADRAFT_15264, partial [Dunaliella salina]
MLPEGSVVVERLTAQCEAVVNHLRDTTSGKVSVARMELYFKLDSSNRIWLMYCNTLRLDRTVFAIDRSPSMQREMPHRQYSLQDPTRHSDSTRINWDDKPFMCALTGKHCSGRQRVDVSYKLLIQAWFREVAELANENDRIGALDNIPPAIRRANPNITRDYYLRMRAQPVFLMKTAPVSADAAAELTPAVATDLARTIARPTSELAKSAGGAALAEPMPIITAAHARDPLLSFQRQQAELMAACSATHIMPHQSIHVYMPHGKKRGSARAHGPALSSSLVLKDLAGNKTRLEGTGAKGGTQSLQAMKDAYASAQATTQELLSQAHEILREPGPPAKPLANTNGTANGSQGSGEQSVTVTNGDPFRPPSSGRRAAAGVGEARPEKGGAEGVGAQGEGLKGGENVGCKSGGSTEAEGAGNKGRVSAGDAEDVGGNSFTHDEHALLSEALMEKSQ